MDQPTQELHLGAGQAARTTIARGLVSSAGGSCPSTTLMPRFWCESANAGAVSACADAPTSRISVPRLPDGALVDNAVKSHSRHRGGME